MSIQSFLVRAQLFSLAVLSGTFAFTLPVAAQSNTSVSPQTICQLGGGCIAAGAFKTQTIPEFITSAISFVLPIVIIVGVVMLLWGAFQFIVGKFDEGRKTITNTIIGIIVALLAVTIVSFVVGLVQGLR